MTIIFQNPTLMVNAISLFASLSPFMKLYSSEGKVIFYSLDRGELACGILELNLQGIKQSYVYKISPLVTVFKNLKEIVFHLENDGTLLVSGKIRGRNVITKLEPIEVEYPLAPLSLLKDYHLITVADSSDVLKILNLFKTKDIEEIAFCIKNCTLEIEGIGYGIKLLCKIPLKNAVIRSSKFMIPSPYFRLMNFISKSSQKLYVYKLHEGPILISSESVKVKKDKLLLIVSAREGEQRNPIRDIKEESS